MPTTAVTATAATVGQGSTVHAVLASDFGGRTLTVCGAEGRGYRQSRVRPSTADVTCKVCAKIAG